MGSPKQKSPMKSSYRQHKHDAMVENILSTARDIMREQGVAALTMQELARRLNLRTPSLYHYFSSKMDVYDALFRLGFKSYLEYMNSYNRGVETWKDYIRSGFEGYFTFAKQNPELFQLCFERPVPGFVPSDESLQLSFGVLQEVYLRAGELLESVPTDLSPQQAVDLVISMMHGLTAMHIANEPELPMGEGRFGSLIPAAVSVLSRAWASYKNPGELGTSDE